MAKKSKDLKTTAAPKKPAAAQQAQPAPKQTVTKAVAAPKSAAPQAKPVKVEPVAPPQVQPVTLIEKLTKCRQDNLNEAIAQLHAIHSQMLHAAGRHANTALQFLNSAPKSGTLADMIDWQSRWLLSHAHVNQDGMKALGSLASKNIEQLQKSLRVDLPKMAG